MIEDEYMDVLQNIEFAVAQFYRDYPEITDYTVMRTYEALIDAYKAEKTSHQPRDWRPTDLEQQLFASARTMCEWRLGRTTLEVSDSKEPQLHPEAIDVETLLLCLKRLLTSAQKWTKHLGRQGYLNFMSQYVK